MLIEQERANQLLTTLLKNQNPVQRFLRLRNTGSTNRLDVKGHSVSTEYNICDGEGHLVSTVHNTYEMDWVFRSEESTARVNEQLRAALELAKEGGHTMIFAQGEQGAGKTTTLFGDPRRNAKVLASEDPSVLQHIMHDLFPDGQRSDWTIHLTWIQSDKYKMFSLLHDGDTYDREVKKWFPDWRAKQPPSSGPAYCYSKDKDCFIFVEGDTKKFLAPRLVRSAAALQYHARRAKKASRAMMGSVVCEMRLAYQERPRGIVTLVDVRSGHDDHDNIAGAINLYACKGRTTGGPLSLMDIMQRFHRVSYPVSNQTISHRHSYVLIRPQQLAIFLRPSFAGNVLRATLQHPHIFVISHLIDEKTRTGDQVLRGSEGWKCENEKWAKSWKKMLGSDMPSE